MGIYISLSYVGGTIISKVKGRDGCVHQKKEFNQVRVREGSGFMERGCGGRVGGVLWGVMWGEREARDIYSVFVFVLLLLFTCMCLV